MAVVLARITIGDSGDVKGVTAGVLFINNKVACHAPVFRFMAGWDGHQVKDYCDKKGWQIERVEHKYDIVQE
jgi:hypothetical protein